MEGEVLSGGDLPARWTSEPDEAGGRRRCPHRPCADDDLRRSAPAGAPGAPAGPADADPADAELAARIAAGDTAALEILYDRHAPAVFALVLAIVGDRQAAEAILGETFYRLWAYPTPVDRRRGPLATRLFGLARELAATEARRRGRAGESARADARREQTESAFASLADDQRRALELAYFDGLDEREIARRLGRPVKQVRRLLRLGLEYLRDQAGKPVGDGGSRSKR